MKHWIVVVALLAVVGSMLHCRPAFAAEAAQPTPEEIAAFEQAAKAYEAELAGDLAKLDATGGTVPGHAAGSHAQAIFRQKEKLQHHARVATRQR